MIKVLFVCLGNICRSPMAEAIFRDLVRKCGLENQISVDSAGTGDWHIGEPPHKGTQTVLQKNNVSFEGIKARQIEKGDLSTFHYIIVMDAENLKNVRKVSASEPHIVIKKLLDFVPEIREDEVPDPYFTGNFDHVYHLVDRGCNKLLESIIEQHDINIQKSRER